MNETDEIYIWKTGMGKLYSVEDFTARHGCSSPEDILIVFPAGSYRRVLDENGTEYFPSTRDGLLWLRGAFVKVSTWRTNTNDLQSSESTLFLVGPERNSSVKTTRSRCVVYCGKRCETPNKSS
ncbi:hypothetical protein BT69DRAFT_1068582 [Atractiella rhizophila]|nr:hypothetical protein BT69DRAFT_1068582 [Atractiella rhizophila]